MRPDRLVERGAGGGEVEVASSSPARRGGDLACSRTAGAPGSAARRPRIGARAARARVRPRGCAARGAGACTGWRRTPRARLRRHEGCAAERRVGVPRPARRTRRGAPRARARCLGRGSCLRLRLRRPVALAAASAGCACGRCDLLLALPYEPGGRSSIARRRVRMAGRARRARRGVAPGGLPHRPAPSPSHAARSGAQRASAGCDGAVRLIEAAGTHGERRPQSRPRSAGLGGSADPRRGARS